MTSFWEHQEKARAQTTWLIFLFGLSLCAFVLIIYLPLAFLVNIKEFSLVSLYWLWSPKLFFWVAGPLLLIIGVGALIEHLRLRKGGACLARQLKAREITQPENQEERILMNVVEEMAIASGIQAPSIYLLEDRTNALTGLGEMLQATGIKVPGFLKRDRGAGSINALVAGNQVEDAVLVLTRGCLDHLTRDELQALIAHEFSHIFNGDMRLNLRVAALVYGVLGIAMIGLGIIFPDEGEGGCLLLVIGLPFVILGLIGGLCARLIQKAVCREREFLADATAVQFTRHPEALAGVFEKIKAGSSRVHVPAASTADHLFFADCRRQTWIPMFRTHPSIEKRLMRIGHQKMEGPREESPFAEELRHAETRGHQHDE